MARLARGNPHRPILTRFFVGTSSPVSVTVPPLINSQAVPVARQARDTAPQRILSQSFINAPASSPIAKPPLIRSRATTNAALAYFRQGNQIVQSSLQGMPGGGGGSGGGGGTSSEQYTGNTREEAMIKAMMAVCLPCCHGSGSGGGSGGGGYCCGCERFRCPGGGAFPDTLNCTITVPCMGTRSVTMIHPAFPPPNNDTAGSCLNLFQKDGFGSDEAQATYYTGSYQDETLTDGSFTYCNSGLTGFLRDFPTEILIIDLYCYSVHSASDPIESDKQMCRNGGGWASHITWYKIVAGDAFIFTANLVLPVTSCEPFYLMCTGTILCGAADGRTLVGTHCSDGQYYSLAASCVGGIAQVEFAE